jgi:hypothetical protein
MTATVIPRPAPRQPPEAPRTQPPRATGARRLLRVTTATGVALSVSVTLGIGALYALCPVHRFPSARAFTGTHWYNPYATGRGQWRKANFHAHAQAWAGLTNGRADPDLVVHRYATLGYDVAAITNYQQITHAHGPASTSLATYEQGYNARKVHLLALGAHSVGWLDYPLFQSANEEQDRVDRLRALGATVVLAHPRLRGGISDDDLRALTGYTALEVASSTTDGEAAWDVALTAGRAVWGMGGDDTHDVADMTRTARVWTLVDAASTRPIDLLDALHAGRLVAVRGVRGQADVALRSLTMRGDTLDVALDGAAATVTFIGAGGALLARRVGSHAARYVIPAAAPYVRVVARTPNATLYLSPVLRVGDDRNARPIARAATIDRVRTWERRAVLLLAALPVVGRRRRKAMSRV